MYCLLYRLLRQKHNYFFVQRLLLPTVLLYNILFVALHMYNILFQMNMNMFVVVSILRIIPYYLYFPVLFEKSHSLKNRFLQTIQKIHIQLLLALVN